MAARKGSKKSGRSKVDSDPIPSSELGTMDYWRNQARLLNPKIEDEWHLSELATILCESAKLVASNFPSFSKVIDRGETNAGSLGIRAVVDRKEKPPTVEVKVVWTEKFGKSTKVNVPDPNQQELPLENTGPSDPGDDEDNKLLGD